MICVLVFLQYYRLLILLPIPSYSYTVQLGSITEKDRNVMKLCLKLKNIHELGFHSAVFEVVVLRQIVCIILLDVILFIFHFLKGSM